MRREGLANVTPVLGRGSDPGLPAAAFDAVLVVDVLHEIEDRVTLLANLGRAMKPGGLIGIVDFKPGGAGPGPDPGDRVPPEEVEREASRAGLVLRRRETFLPFQYFLIFGRQETTTATPPTPGARTRGAAPARPGPPPAP